MKAIRRLLQRGRSLFANERQEEELEREIAGHLAFLEDEFLAQGMAADEARRAARRAYGDVEPIKQQHREERAFQGMARLSMELRYAWRQLRQSPGFALTAILMLALGIGATTTIFSIVEGVLLRPLPFPEPGRLMMLGDVLESSNCSFCSRPSVTAQDVRNYMRDTHSFAHLGGYQGAYFELSGGGEPVAIDAARMSGEAFAALGIQPLLGRVFTQAEDDRREPLVVLSYSLWQSRYHGDPAVVGTKILIERKPYTVTGVMPHGFEFPLIPGHLYQAKLWVPMSLEPWEFAAGSAASWSMRMVGRLAPGVTPEQAEQDAQRVAQATMRDYPAFMSSLRIRSVVKPQRDDTVNQAKPLLRMLFYAVAVVQLIVCANLASLLLVRSIGKRREIAVRLALGARAGALLRQAVVESLMLSTAGGVLGMAFAWVALRVGVRFLPETLPRLHEIGLDGTVLGFALGITALTGFLCGLAPAFAAVRTSVNETLKEGGRTGTAGGSHARLRTILVMGEIAVAMVLLTASGLLLRSFEKMREVDPGFQPDHTLAALYVLPLQHYTRQIQIDGFVQQLQEQLRALPGVKAVGITSMLPADGNSTGLSVIPDEYVSPKSEGLHMVAASLVEGDPFAALGVRLRRGRVFTDADKPGAPLVAIVNRKFAEHYWPGRNPVGKRIRRGMPETLSPWMTVVGEVEDVKMGAADDKTMEQFYQPASQSAESEGSLASSGELTDYAGWIVLRTAVQPEQMQEALRNVVQHVDPGLPLYQMQPLARVVSESEAPRRFNTVLISSFALAALLLSVLGIYSVIAFSVAARRQELAIRMALGSSRGRLLQLVLASGMKVALAGCVLGLLGAVAVSELLRSLLFGLGPRDPLVLGGAAVVMLAIAMLATVLPARRAALVDPLLAVRGE
ncbi:ABC transporter permease [Silvibacterium sp.]|uniref:ABC transporter permease n=1 Tax=Silvibacterium sp. TaxID=1964179 RepID=UPI0039E44880